MGEVLAVRDAAKRFGSVPALGGVSFSVAAGEAVGLLGPNGSGKSTLIRCLVTLQRLDSGSIAVGGVDVGREPARARGLLGYAGQEAALDKLLTGREFLRFSAGIVHLPRAEAGARIEELLQRLDLTAAADRAIETYSGGMKRRLDLAASLLHRPRLLVLDEPSAGLDLEARRRLWEFLRGLQAAGAALLVATHDFEEADVLCGRLVLLARGRVVAAGSPADLRRELGGFIIAAALHEHRRAGDAAALAEIFDGLPGRPLPGDAAQGACDWVLPPATGADAAGQHLGTLRQRAERRGTPLFSLGLRRPSLQDVYRAAVGEAHD